MAGGAGAAAAAGAEAAAAAPPPPLSTPLMKPVVVSAGRVKVKVNGELRYRPVTSIFRKMCCQRLTQTSF